MKKLTLLLTFCLASCGTLEGNRQRMDKTKHIHGPLSVNSYGYITVSDGSISCSSLATYKELIANIEQAVGWDKVEKTSNMEKTITTYTMCKMSVEYVYTLSNKKSAVRICYQDPGYQEITKISCANINDYAVMLAALKTAPEKMKQLNDEIKMMESIK